MSAISSRVVLNEAMKRQAKHIADLQDENGRLFTENERLRQELDDCNDKRLVNYDLYKREHSLRKQVDLRAAAAEEALATARKELTTVKQLWFADADPRETEFADESRATLAHCKA